jgi:hypothetical protein
MLIDVVSAQVPLGGSAGGVSTAMPPAISVVSCSSIPRTSNGQPRLLDRSKITVRTWIDKLQWRRDVSTSRRPGGRTPVSEAAGAAGRFDP